MSNFIFEKLIPSEFRLKHCSFLHTGNLMGNFTANVALCRYDCLTSYFMWTTHKLIKVQHSVFNFSATQLAVRWFPTTLYNFYTVLLKRNFSYQSSTTFLQWGRLFKCIAIKTILSEIILSTLTPSQSYLLQLWSDNCSYQPLGLHIR
jgi:hypothetical protein